ncbi:MAG: LacI family transcriptional regulator [Lachnospiraceae bacterium]|nr:LacI family transcriptional regulator [Lachnospiraceae bacterium]
MKTEEKQSEERIRIKDIAQQIGVSTATVSNVIHGKTKKISQRTVEKVQKTLEESGYIPNMAAVLLAQNSSKIICVVLSNDKKYNHQMLRDPFVAALLNGLSKYLNQYGYFLMLKEEKEIEKIVQYASMWNMAGLILIGYCEMDYDSLRNKMRIPFLVIDGYSKETKRYSDLGIDNEDGGYQVGNYLLDMGHTRVMFLSDNDLSGDHERYMGMKRAFTERGISLQEGHFKLLPMDREERHAYFHGLKKEIGRFSAAFCASDVYAIEFMNYCIDEGIQVPKELSIIGFDDVPTAECVRPRLTTVRQDVEERARMAVKMLDELIAHKGQAKKEILPVSLVIRESVMERKESK